LVTSSTDNGAFDGFREQTITDADDRKTETTNSKNNNPLAQDITIPDRLSYNPDSRGGSNEKEKVWELGF